MLRKRCFLWTNRLTTRIKLILDCLFRGQDIRDLF